MSRRRRRSSSRQSLASYIRGLSGIIQYQPMDETSGSVAVDYSGNSFDGTHVGATLAGDTFAGQPCPTYDGNNDNNQLDEVGLETVFDPLEGTWVLFLKMTQAQWQSAGVDKAWGIVGVDVSNRIMIYKSAADRIAILHNVGGVSKALVYTTVSSDYGVYVPIIYSWSSSGNELDLFTNESKATATFPAGAWTGSDLTTTYCQVMSRIGGLFSPGSASTFVLFNRALSTADKTALYNAAAARESNIA